MTSPVPRILVLQHSPESPLGALAGPIAEAGSDITVIDCSNGIEVTDAHRRFDGLILLGGVQCAVDDAHWPHLVDLLDLIRHYREDRPVLGICLGAQLIARALGGTVFPDTHREFGFVELERCGEDDPLTGGLPERIHIMQWHDDCFTRPADSTPLLTSATCPDHAFRHGERVHAFQGHVEVDEAIVANWGRMRARLTGDDAVPAMLAAQAGRYLDAAKATGREIARRWMTLF